VDGQRHAPATLSPRHGTHFIGGWVGPTSGLGTCGKPGPPGIRSLDIQPVASRYIDWANPDHSYECVRNPVSNEWSSCNINTIACNDGRLGSRMFHILLFYDNNTPARIVLCGILVQCDNSIIILAVKKRRNVWGTIVVVYFSRSAIYFNAFFIFYLLADACIYTHTYTQVCTYRHIHAQIHTHVYHLPEPSTFRRCCAVCGIPPISVSLVMCF